MLSEEELARVTEACRSLPQPLGDYLEDDFVTNLLATVIDFQTSTTAVERALAYYRATRYKEVRSLTDLKSLFARWSPTQDGNTALAVHLWGYRMWTRAQMLRDLVGYLERCGVTDQSALRRWAVTTSFADFRGQVPGLGQAVYQWLVMRLGVDTVKPDVHVRRFVEGAIGRRASDVEVIGAVTGAGRRLGVPAHRLDWAIWETQRSLPAMSAPPRPATTAKRRPPSTVAVAALQDDGVTVFRDNDIGYLTWIDGHPIGFVLNCERRPRPVYLMLHRAGCSSVTGMPARGRRWTTDFLKICNVSQAALDAWALKNTGGTPSRCQRCRP